MLRSPAARLWFLTASFAAVAGGEAAAQVPSAARAGAALAAELGCGACHAGAPGPELARSRAPLLGPPGTPLPADFVFTWLADPQRRRQDIGASRMPDFRLDEGERVALALFLGTDPDAGGALSEARRRHPSADAALGRRIFGALGCAGCHEGVEGATAIQGPDLSREGARVPEGWVARYLADPTPIRRPAHPTAPGARMPDFRLGEEERGFLSSWLGGLGTPFAPLAPQPMTALQTRRIERLLEERVACLGCHRIQGRGGAVGPSLEGILHRARPSFVLEMLLDPGRAAPGSPMPHQPLPRREAERLARYLLDHGGARLPRETPPSLADAEHPAWIALAPTRTQGEALYARHCAACHGAAGGGNGWNAPSLPVPPTRHADATLLSRRVDDALYDGIHAGAWVLDGSARMPGFGSLLTPQEIRALVSHLRTLCACQAPAWSRDAARGGA